VPPTVGPTESPETPSPGGANTNPDCQDRPTYVDGEIVVTSGEANLRPEPSITSEPATLLPPGTEVEVTGRFDDQADCDWWPVRITETGEEGFIREDLLEPNAA
jgi:hypothetical protein